LHGRSTSSHPLPSRSCTRSPSCSPILWTHVRNADTCSRFS
jgi:hypothetical protein